MMTTNDQFYNELSDDYDLMINFEKALDNKISFLQNFISKEDKKALDLGCGTGADAIALSKLGLHVDAVDQSKGMLDQAIKNAKKFDVNIDFIESDLAGISLKADTYNFIVSLGNTIANINATQLRSLISKLYKLMNEGSRILIQIINYAKLPKEGNYVLNVFENDAISLTRQYNIKENTIDFIIDKVDKNTAQESQIITTLHPHSKNDFENMANALGFTTTFYGNLKKEAYVADKSPNLVVVLHRK